MKIATAAVEQGLTVLTPVVEHSRYDMAFDVNGRLYKVQCKWGAYDSVRGVVKIKLQSQRHTPRGYVRTTYTEDETDLVAAYCGELSAATCCPSTSQCAAAKYGFGSGRRRTHSARVLTLLPTSSFLGL